jgi:hypothetical protein
MLHEILSIEESLKSWGLNIGDLSNTNDTTWHPQMPKNNNGQRFLILIDKNLDIAIEPFESESASDLRYFKYSNFASGFTFKYDTNKDSKKRLNGIKHHLYCHSDISKHIDDQDRFCAFKELSNRLSRIDPNALMNKLDDFISQQDKKIKSCYFSLDIPDWKQLKFSNKVQNSESMKVVNDWLISKQTNSSIDIDILNNPADGWENKSKTFETKLPCGVGTIKLYSKNEDNECYERFGMSGVNACKIGNSTRKQILKIINSIVSENFYYNNLGKEGTRNGLWYYIQKDNGRDLVITTLSPSSDWIEGRTEESNQMDIEQWEAEGKKIVHMLNGEINKTPFQCSIFVLFIPKNGACQIKYHKEMNGKNIANCVNKWVSGTSTRPSKFVCKGKFLPPTISNFSKCINKIWKNDRNKISSIIEREYITISDIYDFFFENEKAIKKVTRIFAKNHTKMLIECSDGKLEKMPYERQWLVPISGIVLSKNGFTKEMIMNSVPFLMGQLFSQANNIHRIYFKSRGINEPQKLIGQEYIQQAYKFPKRALGTFIGNFSKYECWAENYIRKEKEPYKHGYLPIREYKEIISKLMNIMPDLHNNQFKSVNQFNEFDPDIYKILLEMGYAYRSPKSVKSEIGVDLEKVSVENPNGENNE